MGLKRQELSKILYPDSRGRRFTQDAPIQLPVWLAFLGEDDVPPVDRQADLLLEPHSSNTVSQAVQALKLRLGEERGQPPTEVILPYNESHILARVTFRELLRAVLPLTSWWNNEILSQFAPDPEQLRHLPKRNDFLQLVLNPAYQDPGRIWPGELLDFIRIAGAMALNKPMPEARDELATYLADAVNKVADLYKGADLSSEKNPPVLFQASLNRSASPSMWRSRLAVKADAAVLLFSIRCKGLTWAVVDSGIDARHPAFRRPEAKPDGKDLSELSRVRRTFDFTRIRQLLGGDFDVDAENSVFASLPEGQREDIQKDLRRRLTTGQQVDWDMLTPLLEVKHGPNYPVPVHEHGTHVAGILAANEPETPAKERDLVGMCPDLELFDVRVIDNHGQGDEFSILAALQFIRFLNSHADRLLIQGVNLSFSIPHAVDCYACGETPVCQECRRLVGSGVVVVAAAGNRGYRGSLGGSIGADEAIADAFEDYRNISITDPGNAEDVITVGSTHRFQPHKYGVSYFSSRGPTGDGRAKPDIVAPGEKVESSTPGGRRAALDGTSMAAPHVSGAAALLMARHRELIGRPGRIKEILCKSATDLGRERAFQGAGMLDVLRALQMV